jgi:hypothetical protein
MKHIFIITCLILATTSAFAKKKGTPSKEDHPAVHVLSRNLDTFFFRVDKEMIGAALEIFSADGQKLQSIILTKKHGLIDFYYETPGTYKIVFRKGDVVENFDYNKTTPSPYIPIEVSHLNVEQ